MGALWLFVCLLIFNQYTPGNLTLALGLWIAPLAAYWGLWALSAVLDRVEDRLDRWIGTCVAALTIPYWLLILCFQKRAGFRKGSDSLSD